MYYPHGASPYGFSTTTLFGGDCSSAGRELQKCVKNPFGREKRASAPDVPAPTPVSAPKAKSKAKKRIAPTPVSAPSSAPKSKTKKRIAPTLVTSAPVVSAPKSKAKKKSLVSDHDPIKPTIVDDYKKIIADLKRPSAIGFTGQQTEKKINEKLLKKIQDPNYGKDSYKDLVIKAKKKKDKKK